MFLIKTERWRSIIFDRSLYRDDFDEVPLNLYCDNNNLKKIYIKNGFAVHPSYNTLGVLYSKISDDFFDFISDKQ